MGLRHLHFPYFESDEPIEIDFFEAISENFLHTRGRPFYILEKMRQRFPIALHGVSLSIAAEDDLDLDEEIEDGKKDFAKNKHISDDDDDE